MTIMLCFLAGADSANVMQNEATYSRLIPSSVKLFMPALRVLHYMVISHRGLGFTEAR